MPAPDRVLELVERFQREEAAYTSGRYNETEARQEFIDPLFEALGWDIGNRGGAAAAYREVLLEYSLKIGSAVKAPDYLIRAGGVNRFFIEAKKPSVNLRDGVAAAYQVRRYAWNAQLPLSVLTDFQEFAVYDCRVEPDKNDKAATARYLYMPYTDYADQWDTIAGLFSREAVLGGALETFAQEQRAPRGALTVDKAFLREIDGWRELLAKNLAVWNTELSQQELNYAVQMTLDRMIFLRICEDRAIEPYGKLQALLSGGEVYKRLCAIFRDADDRYNSGLFHFAAERGRGDADSLTLGLYVDDEPLKKIVRGMYYPDSPYEFSVLPIEVLGNVYEQFLGKVITIGDHRKVEVEEKPEVRKAGGVYYTPAYIVEYIVRHTVGALLHGKTPRHAEKLRILDPACGSGSFLIGAYHYLLDWHRDWYVEHDPNKHRKQLAQGPDGAWRLTTAERKRILLNNIYGVDLDAQAVEVTKLSLCLKMLEGENAQTLGTQLQMFHERALPDLQRNIKCGNSLIGPDFYDSPEAQRLSAEELARVNAFDWQREFAEIMRAGGFDAVIGNPPYIRIQTMKEWASVEVERYKQQYVAASKGNYDIYVVFVERGLALLNQHGQLGFILPHKFFNAQYGEPLRGLLAEGKHLENVVHFGHQQVFSGATTYTCLLFLNRAKQDTFEFTKVDNLEAWRATSSAAHGGIASETVTAKDWNFTIGVDAKLFERLSSMPVKLGDVTARIGQGIRTSANEIYVLDLVSIEGKHVIAHSSQLNRSVELEREAVLLFLQGREIKPYEVRSSGKIVIFPYRILSGRAELIPESEMQVEFPKTFAYLLENKRTLESREKGRFKGPAWYMYGRAQNIDLMRMPKILIPDIADHAAFALDENGQYAFTSGYGITIKNGFSENSKYILGLLNSQVLDFYLKSVSTPLRGGYFRYFTQFVEQLPIRTVNFDDPADKVRHDTMVALVERMLDLHQRLAAAKISHERTVLQGQINATDRQIDRLVYELYDLTEEEIAIVAGTTG